MELTTIDDLIKLKSNPELYLLCNQSNDLTFDLLKSGIKIIPYIKNLDINMLNYLNDKYDLSAYKLILASYPSFYKEVFKACPHHLIDKIFYSISEPSEDIIIFYINIRNTTNLQHVYSKNIYLTKKIVLNIPAYISIEMIKNTTFPLDEDVILLIIDRCEYIPKLIDVLIKNRNKIKSESLKNICFKLIKRCNYPESISNILKLLGEFDNEIYEYIKNSNFFLNDKIVYLYILNIREHYPKRNIDIFWDNTNITPEFPIKKSINIIDILKKDIHCLSEELLIEIVKLDWQYLFFIGKKYQTINICKAAINESYFAKFLVRIDLNNENNELDKLNNSDHEE